uniref:WH2 domain-containing protein n=1 Tax=Heterorhabditis bacteriophora TaxID=37862 RepID=A0A1I7XGX0_HETBA
MSSLRNPQISSLSFPEEYQAPQALGLQLNKNHNFQSVQSTSLLPPPGMSVRAAPIIERIADRHRLSLSPPKDSKRECELPPPDLALLSIDDDEEELPPPPPTVMHSSIVQQMPPQSTIQFVPNDTQIMAPLPPPPPPPPPPLGLLAAPTAATFSGAKIQNEVPEEKKPDSRSNLLAEIQSGIKLKKMSGKLIENALKGVRKRFMDTAALRLSKGSTEYCTVQYRTKMLFDHTVRGGKNARASLSLDTFLALNPEASELEKNIMAECAATLEMVQGFYLIVDDIMDGSERRRQKPCWYKMPDIGLSAVNDAFLLDAFTNEIIRELYASHPNLEKICESYRKSKQITLIGQLLDTASIRNTNGFTWERLLYKDGIFKTTALILL